MTIDVQRQRTLTICLHPEFITIDRELEIAIGYLATWAHFGESGRYSGPVTIYSDRDGNLHATYSSAGGADLTFALFALRDHDTGTYSFHS